MLDIKHTPGPWRADFDCAEQHRVIASNGECVAVCGNYPYLNDETAANARHIVKCVNAWPEVERAVNRLVLEVNEMIKRDKSERRRIGCRVALSVLTDILAKFDGE